jgi:hypothetical protein
LHPMKGPLVTQTLAGLKGFAPYHWRGDMPDLQAFNTNFDILMGGSLLSEFDMRRFVDLLESIVHMPNPLLNLDRSLPSSLDGGDSNLGLSLFQGVPSPTGGTVSCASCHSLPTLSFRPEITPAEGTNATFARKVPTLRQIYKKTGFNNGPGEISTLGFGRTCDGSVAARGASPTNGSPPSFNALSLVLFQQAWDNGTAKSVGYSRSVDASNAASPDLDSEWSILETRAAAGDNDVFVRGEIGGAVRGLAFEPQAALYVANDADFTPMDRAELFNQARQGALFSLVGVAPGDGHPMVLRDTVFADGFDWRGIRR